MVIDNKRQSLKVLCNYIIRHWSGEFEIVHDQLAKRNRMCCISQKEHNTFYYTSIEIYVKYLAEIKFVFHCILYFSHVKKVVSAL